MSGEDIHRISDYFSLSSAWVLALWETNPTLGKEVKVTLTTAEHPRYSLIYMLFFGFTLQNVHIVTRILYILFTAGDNLPAS